MPPRKRVPGGQNGDGLTQDNLDSLAAALAEDRRATVYFREATPSLDLPEGASARVISVVGQTVTVRPKGVDDELPFEADELRITRTAPVKKAVSRAPAKKIAPVPVPVRVQPQAIVAAAVPVEAVSPVPPAPAPPAAAPPGRRTKKLPDGVSVTIFAGSENEWSVTVTHGAKRPGRAQPVSPESVSRAVRELGDPAAKDAVDAVISFARAEAARRVSELSKQLEDARSALAALEER